MRENLLKKQPTWGFRRAQGTGQKSVTPATLTKVILVLLTMFLLPSAAWGQATITVAGITPDGNGNFTGLTGVTFDASTNTLTLDNARVTGTISSSIVDLKINLIGFSLFTLDNTTDYPVLINYTGDSGTTSPKVTFLADKLGASLIAIGSKIDDGHQIYITSGYGYDTDANPDDVWSIRETPYNGNKKIILVSKPYMIIHRLGDWDIDDSYLYNTNENIPKVDWLSFIPATDNTQFMLKLKQSEEDIDYGENTLISPITIQDGLSELVIDLDGNITINKEDIVPINSKNGGGTKSTTIKFTSSTEGSLTLIRTSTGLLENVTPIYDTGWSATITAPQGATDITQATEAIIAKPYDLSVAGIPVTSANAYNVLGDGKVSFTPAKGTTPATLTLDGATLEVSTNNGAAIESNLTDLTVYLVGENLVQAQAGNTTIETLYAFKGNGSNTVTFATDVQNPGTIRGQLLEQYVSKDVTLAYQEGLGLSRQGDSFTIGVITYGITIGETIVTYFNKEDVFGDSKVSFTPATIGADQSSIPATLTLNGASIGQIKMTAAGDLTLHFVGGNTITVENVSDIPIQGYNSSGTLEFSTSNNKTDVLTIVGIENTNRIVYSWFHAPSISATGYEADWAVVSTGATGNTHHITKNNKYDLWINGERFCDTNLAPYPGIAFDPETSTLTYAYTGQDHVIYSGLPSPLTIKMGNSKLKAITFGYPDQQPITATSGTLSIVKYSEGSSENCEFTLEGDGTNSVIRGFTSVDFGDFVVLSDGAKYNNGQLVDASGVAMTTATLSTNPVLPKPEMYSESSDETIQLGLTISNSTVSYGTLKYSIVYADNSEGVTDAVYESNTPPTINKPATVTAWLQLNDMKSEVATGKYFGAKQEVFTVAIGDKIEGTSWFTPEITTEDQISSEFMLQEVDESGVFERKQEGNDFYLVAKKSGTTTVNASLWSEEGITVLNSGIALTFNVGESLNSVFEGENTFGGLYSETNIQVPEGMKAYIITGIDEEKGTVITSPVDFIPAGVPVMLENEGEAKAITHVPYTDPATAPTNNKLNYSNPNTPAKSSATDKWYVIYNNKFVKVTTGTEVRGGKCYLNLNGTSSSGTRSYYDIDGSDGTTGIREVKSEGVKGEKWNDGEWYTLQGQRVTKPTKPGLYILNGKKVVIK